MKMRNQLYKILAVLFVAMPMLQSCDKGEENPGNWGLIVGDIAHNSENEPYLLLDNDETMKLENISKVPAAFVAEGKRVIVNFSMVSKSDQGYDYQAQVNDIDSVLVKNIIPITPETTDSIGNDPVQVLDVWTSPKYLTIQFKMRGIGKKAHMINLVRDYSLVSNPDEDGYLSLQFRHNAKDDPQAENFLWGIASFRIADLTDDASDLKGIKLSARTFTGDESFVCKFDEEDDDKDDSLGDRAIRSASAPIQ